MPTLFWYEIRSVLVMAERRKRIAAARTTAFLSDPAPLATLDQALIAAAKKERVALFKRGK